MNKTSYSILVPYQGDIVSAKVKEEGNELDVVYIVEFPDGFKNTFYTFEVDEEQGWAELNAGATQLAVDVGKALEAFLTPKENVEPFTIAIMGENLVVQPVLKSDENIEINYYKIYSNDKFWFNLKRNDEGIWFADFEDSFIDSKIDETFVDFTAKAIADYNTVKNIE